jgi:membrane peptidoglycan carboxypeptidase
MAERRSRLWRWLLCVPIVLAMVAAIGIGVFVRSVPLPKDPLPPQSSVLYYRDGTTVLARIGVEDRTDVRLGQVPRGVRDAITTAEDRGFYSHFGLSIRGILRALVANVTKGGGEGASTITQQYVRNAYLTQQRTASRKAKEMALALKVEQRFTKDEILERYLNTIYFGRRAYGIQAAANAYFGTTIDRLSTAQGAVLASVIKDPYHFDPGVDPDGAQTRWRWVIRNMVAAGAITKADADAMTYPDTGHGSATAVEIGGPSGLIADRVEEELDDRGIAPAVLRTGGLSVVTTIDRQAQSAAVSTVGDAMAGQAPELRAALVAVDPSTGGVAAYYGGDRGRGFFDDAVAPRPAASTFKPVALAVGLTKGISYQSRWDGSSPRTFTDRLGVPLYNEHDAQCPDCPLDRAMVESLNTPFYALGERVGASNIRSMAVRLGISERYGKQQTLVDLKGEPAPGKTRTDIAIGRYPVTPADLATVYGTFAAGGIRAERHFVTSVTDQAGAAVYTASVKKARILPTGAASDLTTVLAEVVAAHGQVPGHDAAAKTGTQQYGNTSDNQDAWTAGYTRGLAAVTWVGREQAGPIRESNGTAIQGDGMPYRMWQGFLGAALAATPAAPLPGPAHLGADLGDAKAGAARSGAKTPSGAPRAPASSPQSPPSPSTPPKQQPGTSPSPSAGGPPHSKDAGTGRPSGSATASLDPSGKG